MREFARVAGFGIAMACVALGCHSTAISPTNLGSATPQSAPEEQPTPRPSADVILNNQENWPPSPNRQVELKDELGFDADHLYHVPAPGVHPRILFAPEDLPTIRDRLKQTEMGRQIMLIIRANLAKGIDQPGTYENQCFQALVAGDVAGFEKVYASDIGSNPAGAGPSAALMKKASAKWGQRDPFLTSMEMRCWAALIDGDQARGRENAAAIATYAAHLQPRIEKAIVGKLGEDWWRGIRPALGSDSELAFGYDWSEPFMTPQQAATVRHVISLATAGRYTLGMDLPPHWRTWNYIGMALHEPVLSLAIEGEEGYDPRIYARGIEVARDYLTYGCTENGFGKEGIGYQTAGMSHTGVLLLAAANRGTNLFLHPHLQAFFGSYLQWAMEPFGGNWVSEGDLAVFPPNIAITSLAKFVYPENREVDTVFRNLPFVRDHAQGTGFAGNVWENELCCPADPSPSGTTIPSGPPALHTPGTSSDGLSLYDANRGMLITRTDWTPQALALHVDCRVDPTYASHEHADQGQFTFAADGVAWAIVGIRDTETKYHNCVTIDGRGQGYFPPPARWLDMAQSPATVTASVDTKYCWDWFWPKPILLEPQQQLIDEHQTQYIDEAKALLARVPRSQFQREMLPSVYNYYHGFMTGDPRMWSEDSWVYKGPNYPVQRAFRTVALIRGPHPYVVVIDDIQKDDQQRLYEWNMLTPVETDVVSINMNDIVLSGVPGAFYNQHATTQAMEQARAAGGPRLLVRGLNVNQPTDFATIQPNPMLETIELKKHDTSHQFAGRSNGLIKRLVFPSRSVAPDYKMVLVPFRDGQSQPTSVWNGDHTSSTLDWPDQHDVLTFQKDSTGRTRLIVTRDGSIITATAQ